MADLGAVGILGVALAAVRSIDDRSGRADVMTPFEPERAGLFLSGTTKDDANANAARTVRIYERDTGAFVGQAVSSGDGTFSIEVARSVQHDIVCLDDTAGTTYNDLIHRATPV